MKSRSPEETADDRDKRTTRTRTPDPPTRAGTLRGTRPGGRPRARRLAPRRSGDHAEEGRHYRRLTCAHTPSQKLRQAPDRSGAFFMQPRTLPIISDRRFEFGGVLLRAAGLTFMPNKRGNPNWGRPMLPASVLCTEFEMQARHLHLTAGPIRRLGSACADGARKQESILHPRMAA